MSNTVKIILLVFVIIVVILILWYFLLAPSSSVQSLSPVTPPPLPPLYVSQYSALASLQGQTVYVPYYYIDTDNNIYFVLNANGNLIGYISNASPYVNLPPAPLYMVVALNSVQ